MSELHRQGILTGFAVVGHIDDGIGRGDLAGKIQMGINVACCADIAVPQPLLNLLQAHAIGIEQTGAAMAQVVETDTLHLVCDQKIWEMLAQEIGSNPLSHRVYIDIVKVIGAIDIPFDRQQLADFLCVDRAAMSAELSKLQKEGLLVTKRNHFQLLTR